jgi:hypothetical protein
MENKNYQVIGTNICGIKSQLSTVEKSYGHPTLGKYRCCPDNVGTEKKLLTSEPMAISGYGVSQYSDMNKCFNIEKKDIKIITNEMEKNNLNPEEMYDNNYKKKIYKKKTLNLGDNVLSYRIISKKEKNI